MPDPIQPPSLPSFLTEFCARELDAASQQTLFERIASLPPSDRSTLLELLEELISTAPKAAVVGVRAVARVLQTPAPAHAFSWLDLGTAMAIQSSTTAQKYFSDSPDLLAAADPERRQALLTLGLELSDGHHSVVMDFIRAGTQLPVGIGKAELTVWMEAGLRLAEEDRVLAVEYFRISPEVLRRIPVADLPVWVQLGRRLLEPNALGKPDYLKVIEYFRLSADTLSELEPADLRRPFLDLGMILAGRSASIGMDYLRACPVILREFDSPSHRRLILSQGRRLAEAAGLESSVVLDYLRQGSKMFRALEHNTADFTAWVDAGLSLLARNPERARAYFSGRSKTGQDTTERLIGGISLKTIGRTLTLYAEGLSGRSVTIKPTADLPEKLRETIGDSPTTDGRTIYLPDRIRLFPNDDDNFRLYKMTTLHEAGHLEFGTYEPDIEAMRDVVEAVGAEYASRPLSVRQAGDGHEQAPSSGSSVQTAADYFRLFPDPSRARALWALLEDARIDFRLRNDYPGVRREMDQIVAFDLQSRPPLEGLPPRVAVHEALLQLSITDTTEVPLELAETVSGAYDLLLELKKSSATSTDSLRVLARLYRFLEEQLRRFPTVRGEADPLGMKKAAPDNSPEPTASSDQRGAASFPSTLSYRGAMHPDWTQSRQGDKTVPIDPSRLDAPPPASAPRPEARDKTLQDGQTETAPMEKVPNQGSKVAPTRPIDHRASEHPAFLYDEWDEGAQEYRPQWCRLYEHRIRPESGLIVRQTLTSYGPVLRLLRRHFQSLRPEAFRKVKRQTCGEDLDLNAVIEARTELRCGQVPLDTLYIKKEKRLRDVAVAFLIDMSGSTSRQIPSAQKRVIELEQEALILMSEALQAVGDPFAIYGFSGDSKDRVDFYIIKDFSDALNATTHERIGAMRSLNQNRDGTAIRHASAKLEQQPAKTRLLILLSDGKPLDTGYTGDHSLQDTKMALKEARMRGIHPYCITIDKEASRYVTEMYGEVGHTIIDRVSTLPDKLPRIYRRLTT
ncbi:MAG: VWA domain-containing protein [Nitrospirae bacterium]|nr:VWA domain-containing protein [Nitrospirota bacterium]